MSDRSFLEEISIRGLGVIEEATLELSPGFTVLTGETGAGKTMVLTALALVLGGKSESSLVRQGNDRLVASATFRVTEEIEESAIDKGANVEVGRLILTRTVTAQSKSKATAGGVNVPLAVLVDLSDELIEIHAQSASMSITKQNAQRDILDRFGGVQLSEALDSYRHLYEKYVEMVSRISSLRKSANNREKEVAELLQFSKEVAQVQPQVNEWSAILIEIERLGSVEELRIAVAASADLLNSEDASVLSAVYSARKFLESVQEKDPLIAEMNEKVVESAYLLSDFAQSASAYLLNLEADPNRLDFLQSRKSDLLALNKRFSQDAMSDESLKELIARYQTIKETIADLIGGEDRIVAMERELALLAKDLLTHAKVLSNSRSLAAKNLSLAVSKEIHSLSMPHTNFACEVMSPDYTITLPANVFGIHGCDEVSMLLQAHKEGPLVSVGKGASGGELSRIMLALEVVLAQSQPVGTYIFDEVDAGVGGKAAIEVGRRLFNLSKHAQVIAITHLPQVAAWADSHFVVRKSSDGSVTQSDVLEVRNDERIEEIARMLAGHEDSRSAKEHATELLAMRG